MPPSMADMYGSNHPLAIAAARRTAQQSQGFARNTGLMAPPAPRNPMMDFGRDGVAGGVHRNLHAFGDAGPGTEELKPQAAFSGQAYLNQTTPGLSQQGPQFQRWANDPGRIAQDKAAHGLWSPEQLASETTKAQQDLQGRINTASTSRGLPAHQVFGQPRPGTAPMQPGGMLAGVKPPTVAPVTPPAQAPAKPDPFGPDWWHIAPPSPGQGAAARNTAMTMTNSAGVAPEPVRDPSIHMPDSSPVPGINAMMPRRPNPAVRPPGGPPAVAPVAAPDNPVQQYLAGQRAHANALRARGGHGMADAVMADATANASQMQMAWEAHQAGLGRTAAETSGLTADAEGKRLGFPSIQAQGLMHGQAAAMGAIGRILGEGVASSARPLQELLDYVSQMGGGRADKNTPRQWDYNGAMGHLFGSPATAANRAKVFPDQGGSPIDSYNMARQLGMNLDDPGMADPFRAALMGHYGSQAMNNAGADPWHMFGQPTPEALARARFMRGEAAPSGPQVQGPTQPVQPPQQGSNHQISRGIRNWLNSFGGMSAR